MGNDSGINEYDRRNPELSDATLRITTTRHHQYRVIIPLKSKLTCALSAMTW